MAQAYKCDRCKKFFDGHSVASVVVAYLHDRPKNRSFELCVACAESVADSVAEYSELVDVGEPTQGAITVSTVEPLCAVMEKEAREKNRLYWKDQAESCSTVINAIKEVRKLSGMGLKEAKDFVESECVEWVNAKVRERQYHCA